MLAVTELLDRVPGRQLRRDFRKRLFPPLWFWLRSGFFFSCGAVLVYFGLGSYGRILMTLAVLQIAGSVLAVFFQEFAKALQRYFGAKQSKNEQNDTDD